MLKFDRKTEEPYVEVQTEDGKFEKRTLKLGTSDGVNIEVLEGVTLEEKLKFGIKPRSRDKRRTINRILRFRKKKELSLSSFFYVIVNKLDVFLTKHFSHCI